MNATYQIKTYGFAAVAGIVIIITGWSMLHFSNSAHRDHIATAFLLDLVLTFPAIYYLSVIRPLKQSCWQLLVIFSCGCAVAYFLLPLEQRSYIVQLRKMIFLMEAGVIIFAITKINQIYKRFKTLQEERPGIARNLQASITDVLGSRFAIKVFASELTVMRFGLFFWKKTNPIPSRYEKFTNYKNSGYSALFGIIIFISLVELCAVHLLLLKFNTLAAIITSSISLYGIIFLISDYSAIIKNPVLISSNELLLCMGFRWHTNIDLSNILSIEKIKENYQPEGSCFKGAIVKSSVNVMLSFKEPVSVNRIYRKPITVSSLLINIDEAEEFNSKVHLLINQNCATA